MSTLEDIADGLAIRAMELIQRTGDENIEKRIADEIGASSPTLEERFLTAVRLRKAEARALELFEKYSKGEDIPLPAITSKPQDEAH